MSARSCMQCIDTLYSAPNSPEETHTLNQSQVLNDSTTHDRPTQLATLWPPRRKRLHTKGYGMVLLGRIELPTSSLPMTRSTTELQQPAPKVRPYAKPSGCCQATCAARLHLPSTVEWRRMQRTRIGLRRSGFAKPSGPTCAAARQNLNRPLAM